jgi:hypothetical protein
MGNATKPRSKDDYNINQVSNPSQNRNFPSLDYQENSVMSLNNDNFSKIKQSLKYLYKNNFTSLTFVNFKYLPILNL